MSDHASTADDDRYDRDARALAWARAKVQESVDRAEGAAANTTLGPEAREQWRRIATYMRRELLTREGCVHAAFDERLPAWLQAIAPQDPPSPDSCRPVEIDGEMIRVRGNGELTEEGRAALSALVRAAKQALAQEQAETGLREQIADANEGRRRAEQAEDLLRVANETSNRSETERARAVQRAESAERDLRDLRAGLRANGADPTQLQNLWAQISLRNRQWREAKRELRLTRSMLEEEGGDVSLVDEMISTVEKAEHEAREARAAIERVRDLREPIAEALEQADYRLDMRRGDLADSIMPVIRHALDGTEQPTTEA